MIRNRYIVVGVGLMTALLVSGCSTYSRSPLNFTVRAIPQMQRDAVLRQTQIKLSQLDYDVQFDHAGALIATQFIKKTGRRLANQSSPATQIPGKYRRIVQIYVEEVDHVLKIFCKVVNELRMTETHRLLAYDQVTSDTPAQTPIQRDAATTPEQNTVWQKIRRDKPAERRILAQILE